MQTRKELTPFDKLNRPPFRVFIAGLLLAPLLLSFFFAAPASAVEDEAATASVAVNAPMWLAYCRDSSVTTLNVRDSPSLSGSIEYTLGYPNNFYLTGKNAKADGYLWWELTDGNWVADTGGWVRVRCYYDYVTAYDQEGQEAWSHYCVYTEECFLHYEVGDYCYTVVCSNCGWTTTQYTDYIYSGDTLVAQFCGLDTDGDEILDTYPGQSKDVPRRGMDGITEVTVYEMYGDPMQDVPTVTIWLHDRDFNTIATYTFEWYVDISIDGSAIYMVGMDGTSITHLLDSDDYMLQCDKYGYFLGDLPSRYKPTNVLGEDSERHYTYGFQLARVGTSTSDGRNLWEKLIHYTRNVCTSILDFFDNFFGLGKIFTADGPFKYILSGFTDGVSQVFAVIQSFFSALPQEIVYGASFLFVGTIIIGLLRWFR